MLTQQITPEILQWISAQAQAGHPSEAVLDSMLRSGWEHHIARAAIEQLKRGRVLDVPEPVRVPDPDPTDSLHSLRAGDRTVQVLATLRNPRIMVFGGLLADDECDELIAISRSRLVRSGVVNTWGGTDNITEWRTSEGTSFSPGETDLLGRIERRIAGLIQWPADHGEGMQVLHYDVGAEYRPHHDYFDPSVPGSAGQMKQGGQRVATLLMYLNTPARGGATGFPEVPFKVAPLKGNAVFFSYDRAHPISRTLHAGEPVLEGEKWLATKWLRAAPTGAQTAS